jgi:hypothetical protein
MDGPSDGRATAQPGVAPLFPGSFRTVSDSSEGLCAGRATGTIKGLEIKLQPSGTRLVNCQSRGVFGKQMIEGDLALATTEGLDRPRPLGSPAHGDDDDYDRDHRECCDGDKVERTNSFRWTR